MQTFSTAAHHVCDASSALFTAGELPPSLSLGDTRAVATYGYQPVSSAKLLITYTGLDSCSRWATPIHLLSSPPFHLASPHLSLPSPPLPFYSQIPPQPVPVFMNVPLQGVSTYHHTPAPTPPFSSEPTNREYSPVSEIIFVPRALGVLAGSTPRSVSVWLPPLHTLSVHCRRFLSTLTLFFITLNAHTACCV